jgi:hypothetical protein
LFLSKLDSSLSIRFQFHLGVPMKHPVMPCMAAMALVVSPRQQGGEELPKAMLFFFPCRQR